LNFLHGNQTQGMLKFLSAAYILNQFNISKHQDAGDMPMTKTALSTTDIIMRKPEAPFTALRGRGIGIVDDTRLFNQFDDLMRTLEKIGAPTALLPTDGALLHPSAVGTMAFVTEYMALIGHPSFDNPQQNEARAIVKLLAPHKFLKFITAQGLLDCTDIVRVGRHIFIGLSRRTNQEGAAQAAFYLTEAGFQVSIIEPRLGDDAALSSLLTALDDQTIIIRPELARHYAFLHFDRIITPLDEKNATGALILGQTALLPHGCPSTLAVNSPPVATKRMSSPYPNLKKWASHCVTLRSPSRHHRLRAKPFVFRMRSQTLSPPKALRAIS
jgi:dimethylargininase